MLPKTKALIAIAIIAALFFVYSSKGTDFFSLQDFSFGDITGFPERPVFNESVPQFIENITVGIPVSKLTLFLHTKAAMSVSGEVLIYSCNKTKEGWICDTPHEGDPLVALPVNYGKTIYNRYEFAAPNATILYIDTPYSIYFKGSNRFYDAFLGEETFDDENYELMYEVDAVGTIIDPLNEERLINNQISTDLREEGVEIGCIGGCENNDILIYNETKGDGKINFDISIGCGGYGCECRDIVLYFDFDFPKPEGNELKTFKAEHISGKDLFVPVDWLSYFKRQNRIYLGSMPSGTTMTYRIWMEFQHFNLDENDPFCMVLKDLNGGVDVFDTDKAKGREICFEFMK